MAEKNNCCLNNKITEQQKKVLLSKVLDDITLKAVVKQGRVVEEFEINLANIIIATGGNF